MTAVVEIHLIRRAHEPGLRAAARNGDLGAQKLLAACAGWRNVGLPEPLCVQCRLPAGSPAAFVLAISETGSQTGAICASCAASDDDDLIDSAVASIRRTFGAHIVDMFSDVMGHA